MTAIPANAGIAGVSDTRGKRGGDGSINGISARPQNLLASGHGFGRTRSHGSFFNHHRFAICCIADAAGHLGKRDNSPVPAWSPAGDATCLDRLYASLIIRFQARIVKLYDVFSSMKRSWQRSKCPMLAGCVHAKETRRELRLSICCGA
jgi:hypothetical protein